MGGETQYVRWFRELSIDDVALVGGKNASLGEMYRELTGLGVLLPNGFAVTIDAYNDALSKQDLDELHGLLDPLSETKYRDMKQLEKAGKRAREIVYNAGLPEAAEKQIWDAYEKLVKEYGTEEISMAVRSSATAEDLPTASFAGQHDTYLNISGRANLVEAVKRCNASLFTDRAISYRIDQGFDHFKVALSACVMKMVRSDLACSGVMFSIDTETGFKDSVFVTGAFGLGENVVQGAVDPDEYYVHKAMLKQGHRAVLRRRLGRKQLKMIYATGRSREPVRNIPTPYEDRSRFCLTDEQVLVLADYAVKIEDHYSKKRNQNMPMDMEWALDGLDGKLYIVQARPETVAVNKKKNELKRYIMKGKGSVLARGRAVGTMASTGKVRVIKATRELQHFQEGEILVADTTTPDWEPVMKKAAGIITNRGGRTCHASIVARELQIPAVVGADKATSVLETGTEITLSCCEGDVGFIYEGAVPFEIETTDLSHLELPQCEMMINLGNPDSAFEMSFLPCDGVGLARLEFIINEHIKAHPMALLHPDRIENASEKAEIEERLKLYKDGADLFVRELSEGVGTIAGAFYPRPVVVRFSDFKSNEYASLCGGRQFEPHEENPMIGFRGAARYVHPAFEECFALECMAMKRVREEMGFRNLKLMIPFCRTLKEAHAVLSIMEKYGLKRGENGLEVYVMCEIPNNVILIDEFAKLFDGFSIGSNDLTQLTLGCDRDSEMVANEFDERDPGVMKMLEMAVEGCKRNKRHSGICGQAPSDFVEVAQRLVELGIDSMSLTPDSLLKTIIAIRNLEKSMGRPTRT